MPAGTPLPRQGFGFADRRVQFSAARLELARACLAMGCLRGPGRIIESARKAGRLIVAAVFQRVNNLMYGWHCRPAVRDFVRGQMRVQRDLFPLRLDRLRLAADVAARVSGTAMGDGRVS